VVSHEHVDGGGGQPFDILSVFQVELGKKMFRQQHDVPLAFGEVRHNDGENVQPVVQVFPELARRHQFLQIAAGGGDEAHVCMKLPVASHAGKGLFLKKAQQLHLHLEA